MYSSETNHPLIIVCFCTVNGLYDHSPSMYHSDGSDFNGINYVHEFPAGFANNQACTDVELLLDGVVERNELFEILLSINDTSSLTVGVRSLNVFIVNNDSKQWY